MTNNTKKSKPSYKDRKTKTEPMRNMRRSKTLALDQVRLPENFVLPQTVSFTPDSAAPDLLTYGDFSKTTPRLVQTVVAANDHLATPDYTTGLGFAAMDTFQKLRVINRANTNYSVEDLYYYLLNVGRIAMVYYSSVLRNRVYSTFNSYMPGLHKQACMMTPNLGLNPAESSLVYDQKSFFAFNSAEFMAYPTQPDNYIEVAADLSQVSNLLSQLPIPTNYGRFINHLFGNLFLDDKESRNDTYHVCVQAYAKLLNSEGDMVSEVKNPWSTGLNASGEDARYLSFVDGVGAYYDYLMSNTGLSTMVMDLYKSGLCSGVCQPMTIPEVTCAIEPVYSPGYAMFITNNYTYVGGNVVTGDWKYEIDTYMRFDDTDDMRLNTSEGAFWATLSNLFVPYTTSGTQLNKAYLTNKGLLGTTHQVIYVPIADWGSYDVYLMQNFGTIQTTDTGGKYVPVGAVAAVVVPGVFATVNLAKPMYVLALPAQGETNILPANGLYATVTLHKRYNNATYSRKENVNLVAEKSIISLFE